MDPLPEIPESAKKQYPNHKEQRIGPPENIAEEDCGYSMSLLGHVPGGAFDGAPIIRTFFQPTPDELEILNRGGYVELYFISPAMPPHNLLVWSD